MNKNNAGLLTRIANFDVYLSRKPVRNINLRIDSEGNIKISVPLKYPSKKLSDLLEQKKDWIEKHQSRLQTRVANNNIETKGQHIFLGETYSLTVMEHAGENQVFHKGKNICCLVKFKASPNIVSTLLLNWQKQEFQVLLPSIIEKWEAITGLHASSWRIKVMKSRWGSCNTVTGSISLNLLLIHYPILCLEYVVLHELVHLLEPSHNKKFHALMSRFMPDWKEYRNILRGN